MKSWLRSKKGIRREHVKGYIKEKQYRLNNGSIGMDLFLSILKDWGILETHLREGIVDIDFVESLVDWDWEQYLDLPDLQPFWNCPGCDFTFEGKTWQQVRKEHKTSCKYYNLPANHKVHEHKSSRCACCIYAYHDNAISPLKRNATRVIHFIIIIFFVW